MCRRKLHPWCLHRLLAKSIHGVPMTRYEHALQLCDLVLMDVTCAHQFGGDAMPPRR